MSSVAVVSAAGRQVSRSDTADTASSGDAGGRNSRRWELLVEKLYLRERAPTKRPTTIDAFAAAHAAAGVVAMTGESTHDEVPAAPPAKEQTETRTTIDASDAGQNSQCLDTHWELIMGKLIQVALAARKITAPPRTPSSQSILGHSRTLLP